MEYADELMGRAVRLGTRPMPLTAGEVAEIRRVDRRHGIRRTIDSLVYAVGVIGSVVVLCAVAVFVWVGLHG
jgi:hypothetical protein